MMKQEKHRTGNICCEGCYRIGKDETLAFVKEEIEKMIEEQEDDFEKCKEIRTTRMKNWDSKNCGMIEAEQRIEHYKELKQRLGELK